MLIFPTAGRNNQTVIVGVFFLGSLIAACKPPEASRVKAIATANSFKTGIFMPERTEDLAKSSGNFSGSTLTADELMAKLNINPTNIPAGIRYAVPTKEQDLILVIRQAPGARPIPLGGISKDGQLFYFSATLAAVEDTPFIVIGKTFFKIKKPDEPLKVSVSADGNVSNAYQVITVEDATGGLEEYLISYLNILLTGDKVPIALAKIGNKLVSPFSGKTMIEYREVGNQVWVVGGGIANKHFKNGSILWSTNMRDFYSIRDKGKSITQWKKQDNNSMDVAAENVTTKIPQVVTDLLEFHAGDAEITGEDSMLSGPTFGTVGIGASSLVDRTVNRITVASSSGFSLSGSEEIVASAPDESSGDSFDLFFQPGKVGGQFSLGEDSIPLPTTSQLAKEDWIRFNQLAKPGTNVTLPGGAVGRVIGRTSLGPSDSTKRSEETSHHYLIQDNKTGEVYKVTHVRSGVPSAISPYYWRTPNIDSQGRKISSTITKLAPSEVSTLGQTSEKYKQASDSSWTEAQREIQKFTSAQQKFDGVATKYMDKWSPVDMDAPQGQWRANLQGIGNWALLGASAALPSTSKGTEFEKVAGAVAKGQIGLAQAALNKDGASMFSTNAGMATDMFTAALGAPYATQLSVLSKVAGNQGFKYADGNFNSIDFTTTATSEAVSGFGGKVPGLFGVAAKLSKPIIEGVGTLAQAPSSQQQRLMEVAQTSTINNNNLSQLYRQGSQNLYIPPKYATMQPTVSTSSYTNNWVSSNSTSYSAKPVSSTTSSYIGNSLSSSNYSSKPLVLKPMTSATMQALPSNSIPVQRYTSSSLPSSVSTSASKPYVSPTMGSSTTTSGGSSFGGSSFGGSSFGGSSFGGSSSGSSFKPSSGGGINPTSTLGPSTYLKEP